MTNKNNINNTGDNRIDINEKRRQKRVDRIASGVCADCGKKPPVEQKRSCTDCLNKSRERKRDLVGNKNKRQERKLGGFCSKCGNKRERPELSRCDSCINKIRSYRKSVDKEIIRNEWKQQGAKKRKNRQSRGMCDRCGKLNNSTSGVHCADCIKKKSEISKATYRRKQENRVKTKINVIIKYGGACECCLESDYRFLCIDHINNDGNKERKEKGHLASGPRWYKTLESSERRNDLRVLCYNCNIARSHHNGVCPHKMSDYQKTKAVE